MFGTAVVDQPGRTQIGTVAEAAEALGLIIHTVRAWISSRRLRHVRLGRAIRIFPADIKELLKNSTVPALDGVQVPEHPLCSSLQKVGEQERNR